MSLVARARSPQGSPLESASPACPTVLRWLALAHAVARKVPSDVGRRRVASHRARLAGRRVLAVEAGEDVVQLRLEGQ
jgi:hypothetical protein